MDAAAAAVNRALKEADGRPVREIMLQGGSFENKRVSGATGLTPHRRLTAQRIDLAKSLLAERSVSLAYVAMTCGFSDQSHFPRAFAKGTGATPEG